MLLYLWHEGGTIETKHPEYEWGMNLGQDSVIPQFWGGGAERLKTQNLFFFLKNQLIENQKLCNISKPYLPKSIRRGDKLISPSF